MCLLKFPPFAPSLSMSSSAISFSQPRRRRGRRARRQRALPTGRTEVQNPVAFGYPLPTVRDPAFPVDERIDNKPFNLVQSFETLAFCASSNVASTFTGTSFALSSLDQVVSLTAVFDQYRIRLIEVTLLPRLSNSGGQTNTGVFTTVIDYDDATALTSIGQAMDYSNQVSSGGDMIQRRVFVPHVAIAAYSGAFTSFANRASPWIDSASTNVQHYGLKTAWTVTGAVNTYDAIIRMWVQFRNVR